jgi:ankyrin repeat protein
MIGATTTQEGRWLVRRTGIGATLALVVSMLAPAGAQDQGALLRKALFAGTTAQITTLSRLKVAVNTADADGVTPLMIASALGKTDVVKTLLETGAAPDAHTKADELTALMFAADAGHLDTVQVLIDGGASVQAVDKFNCSAVDYASSANIGDTKADIQRELAVSKYLRNRGAKLRNTSKSPRGTGDLKAVLDKAKAVAAKS